MHVLIHTSTFVATPPSSSKGNTRATENAQTVYTVYVCWCYVQGDFVLRINEVPDNRGSDN